MTVLTSRRAVLVTGRTAIRGRLRLSDRTLRFEPAVGAAREVRVAHIRRIALRRRALVVETPSGSIALRCFGVRGVAGLLVQACSAHAGG